MTTLGVVTHELGPDCAISAEEPDAASDYVVALTALHPDVPEELRRDLAYMQRATLLSDLRVLFRTLGAVLRKGSAT